MTGPPDAETIIEHFNIFPFIDDNNSNNSNNLLNGNTQYPVYGEIYQRNDAGFFAVDTDQEFYNDGSDPSGILAGKYAINNIKSDPESILYDETSGVLLPGETMIKDITTVRRCSYRYSLYKQFK